MLSHLYRDTIPEWLLKGQAYKQTQNVLGSCSDSPNALPCPGLSIFFISQRERLPVSVTPTRVPLTSCVFNKEGAETLQAKDAGRDGAAPSLEREG